MEKLYLDNNQLTYLNFDAAQSQVPKLKTLTAHHNKINYFYAMNMRNLTKLDLSNNEINNFSVNAWSRTSLKEITIDLSYNLIKELNLTKTLNVSANSIIMNLKHNKLKTITLNDLKKLQSLKFNLILNGNPWSCDCPMVDLMKFNNIIKDYNELACFNDTSKVISMLKMEDICFFQSTTLLVICGIAMLVLCILIGVLIFKTRMKIKHYINPQFETECNNTDKEFDAFVMYSKYDQDFVENQLTINLEEIENPYKLCIHVRDFEAGEQIMTNVSLNSN